MKCPRDIHLEAITINHQKSTFHSKFLKYEIIPGHHTLYALGPGCSNVSRDQAEPATLPGKMGLPSTEEMQAEGSSTRTDLDLVDKKIIRNGVLTLSVSDALQTRQSVEAIIRDFGAYVSHEQLDNNDYQSNYSIQIRVQADRLDSMVAALEGLDGTVTYKSIQARDVTEEFIDLETRLGNKKAYLEQYRSLLKNARTIEDILKVQEQIRVLEEEIESVTGRLNYLSNQVELSTLELTIHQQKDFVYRPDRKINFMERLKDSLSSGWFVFVNFMLGVITLWPFWILVVVMIVLWRRFARRKKGESVPKP